LRRRNHSRYQSIAAAGSPRLSKGSDMISEFKAFIARGNVLDLAVGVIIGGAFATITKSLTEDIIMPVVSAIFGGVDFTNKFILLGAVPDGVAAGDYAKLKEAGVAMLGYGAFITAIINFLILAFAIFLIVRQANKMTPPPAAPTGPSEVELLTEIRDALKK
jgi:large conductance mechanosensitive channel